ncbi:hypothetical protein CMUS01_14543 [Colletotrichum musicola]|uniref:Uncharacterized protein n=1 Tax=Colletotrichum musicola TaxID=2175873 RepID=A0A8H6J4B7_9PEZI|nr:hypothetical protein CMUS01_14543 [Colletotrichum musicola]
MWSYVYFCVGEVQGRTFEEIEGFFRDCILAKHWVKQPRAIPGEEADKAINMDVKEIKLELPKDEHLILVKK